MVPRKIIMPKVTREDARKVVVSKLNTVIPSNVRVQWPGTAQIDVSTNKNLFLTVRLVYMDGSATELGDSANNRLIGILEITFNYKEGNAADYKTFNSLADTIQSLVSNTDRLKPLRTYATRQETPRRDFNIQVRGSESGWITETLVTPFWYDTEI